MLLSHIDKKKKGKKNILALTTMHNQVKLSVSERKKPHALVFYDHTKSGVDIVDLISDIDEYEDKKVDTKYFRIHA